MISFRKCYFGLLFSLGSGAINVEINRIFYYIRCFCSLGVSCIQGRANHFKLFLQILTVRRYLVLPEKTLCRVTPCSTVFVFFGIG